MTTALVKNVDVRNFIVRLMVRAGTNNTEANDLAKVLVDADYRGHFSHGINRLEMYFNDVRVGATASGGQPTILSEKGATAWIDGENLLGSTVSNFAMDLAIKKSQRVWCWMGNGKRIKSLFNCRTLGNDGRGTGFTWNGIYEYIANGDTD